MAGSSPETFREQEPHPKKKKKNGKIEFLRLVMKQTRHPSNPSSLVLEGTSEINVT